MRNRMYGGVRGRKTKVGRKLLRFPPTRLRNYHQTALKYKVVKYGCKNVEEVDVDYLGEKWV